MLPCIFSSVGPAIATISVPAVGVIFVPSMLLGMQLNTVFKAMKDRASQKTSTAADAAASTEEVSTSLVSGVA